LNLGAVLFENVFRGTPSNNTGPGSPLEALGLNPPPRIAKQYGRSDLLAWNLEHLANSERVIRYGRADGGGGE
jgi:hypothetical protein